MSDDPKTELIKDNGEGDFFLRDLILTAISTDTSLAITLTIGGSLVSGLLVSPRRWFKEYGEIFASAFENQDLADTLKADYETTGNEIADRAKKNAEENYDQASENVKYIHLVDAVVFAGSKPLPTQGKLIWRGRVSEVSGFSLGMLSHKTT